MGLQGVIVVRLVWIMIINMIIDLSDYLLFCDGFFTVAGAALLECFRRKGQPLFIHYECSKIQLVDALLDGDLKFYLSVILINNILRYYS
jgi:hypothetical protein